MTDQLTLFALPKAMCGRTGIHQKNSIRSWLQLNPRPRVILFGQEEGVAELAKELGIDWHPNVECTRFGTPRVDDVFQKAEKFSDAKIFAYVSSELILMNDFMKAVQAVSARFSEFLMSGSQWNIDLEYEIDFSRANWREELRDRLKEKGTLLPHGGMDYFVFSRGLYQKIPPFGMGRTAWDCWLLRDPLCRGKPVIDATKSILSIHHDQNYSHINGTKDQASQVYTGEEGKFNQELAGAGYDQGTLSNAPLQLSNFEVRPRSNPYLESDFLRAVQESLLFGLSLVQQDLERKDLHKALRRIEKCVELKTDYPGLYYLVGVLQNVLGDSQGAVEALVEELKRFPAQVKSKELLKELAPELVSELSTFNENLPDLHESEVLALAYCAKQTTKPVRMLDYSHNNEARFILKFCLSGSEVLSARGEEILQNKFDLIYLNANEEKQKIGQAWSLLNEHGILMISSSAQQLSDFDLPEQCFLVVFQNPRLIYPGISTSGVYFLTTNEAECEKLASGLALEFPECLISRRVSLYSNVRRTTKESLIDRQLLNWYQI